MRTGLTPLAALVARAIGLTPLEALAARVAMTRTGRTPLVVLAARAMPTGPTPPVVLVERAMLTGPTLPEVLVERVMPTGLTRLAVLAARVVTMLIGLTPLVVPAERVVMPTGLTLLAAPLPVAERATLTGPTPLVLAALLLVLALDGLTPLLRPRLLLPTGPAGPSPPVSTPLAPLRSLLRGSQGWPLLLPCCCNVFELKAGVGYN